MSLEPPELAALKRALGRQLAALREAAELGQQQVGRRAGYSRSSVAHAEAGRQLLTRDFWQTADELLRAEGALLAGYERVKAVKQEHERQSREAELAEAYAAAQALRATAAPYPSQDADKRLAVPTGQEVLTSLVTSAPPSAGVTLAEGLAEPLMYLAFLSSAAQATPAEWGDQVYDQLTKFLRGWADTMNRRELLQLLGWSVTTVAASPVVGSLGTEEQERLARAIVSPSRVDEKVINHLDAMLRHCQLQEDALGSRAVLPTLLGQQNLVRDLLRECPANLRVRLLSAYSNMSTSIGYYFFELNDVDRAKHYHEQARAAAHDAGSTELSIYALCEWSYTESWQGKAVTGIDLAAAAQSLASKTQDPLMRVGAAQRAATAYAFDGQHKACMVEFERAQASLAASVGQTPPESPAYFYDEGYLTSHKSECLLRLGKPQEAAVNASAGLRLYDKSFVDGYAVCTLHLGNAHLQSGEIDEAARVVGSVASLAAQTRSARLAKELRTTRARMQPWQGTQAIRELDEQLAGCGMGMGFSA